MKGLTHQEQKVILDIIDMTIEQNLKICKMKHVHIDEVHELATEMLLLFTARKKISSCG